MAIRIGLVSEVVVMAFDTVRTNKMRSALTILGVVIGITSIVGMTAMMAASLAQVAGYAHAIYPSLTGLNPIFPVAAGLACGLIAGLINGSLIALTKIPAFIATLGMMVSARGVADWYTNGQPIGNLSDGFAAIGAGWWPVVIFLAVALIFHIALRYTRYGKFTYAIGANPLAARVSGINVERHMIAVYTIAGLLSGLSGIVHTARAISGQAGVGVGFELDAIAASSGLARTICIRAKMSHAGKKASP